MTKPFRKRVLGGEILIGCIQSLPSTEITEILATAGLDWLFVDLEHGPLDIQQAQSILQTASPKLPCAIRCPSNDEVWIKKCLDLGPDGIIIPQIQTKSDAERAMSFCKYSPLGQRSVGLARAQGYGMRFNQYINQANDCVAVVVQIEHITAVGNIEGILQVPGIDAVFIGPYDLSGSLNKIGNVTDPEVVGAIATVRRCCKRKKTPLGIFGATPEAVKPYIEEGYRLIAVGTDAMLLGRAARELAAELREQPNGKAQS